ncbi:hypothetical protein [Arthrobacter zhaoguopingii]|uniref:hypothetical protein n=1 Tax=Arthrobacter zhaoguopingii TaxID=2681491 RepID=UPI00135A3892|nr:hypothetical protein [Arthrobacter zhaoguopingii]
MSSERVRNLVADTLSAMPVPESLGDVSPRTQAVIARDAASQGVEPEALWAAVRAQHARQVQVLDAGAEARAVALRVRRGN